MSEADLAAVEELRRLAGWNQTPQDWRRMLLLEPGGCFVALRKGVVAGSVTTTSYGTRLAWIGMMLVHPDHRRIGLATRLMNRALGHLKERQVQCVKLDATPAGQPLYQQLGFVSEWTLHRWQRTTPGTYSHDDTGPTPSPPLEERAGERRSAVLLPKTRPFQEYDWPAVEKLDLAVFGAARAELLRCLARDSRRALVWPESGPVLGFGFLRHGANSDYIGPLECVNGDGAGRLLSEFVTAAEPSPLTWDIPDLNDVAKAEASRLGFKPMRPLTRMRLGPPTDAPQAEALYGIADPAVG